ncbi:MAG: Hsp70 family protein, partial [SAR202 cluster bacterium]|nr:Hsp70 family protein [SAR202 cluster bacterium]
PDEVVAMGAAIQAGMVLGLIDKAVLLDVLPLSLGIETQGGLMATIIPRNTALPASGSRIFTTAADYQTSMDIHMLQGERALAVDNISLEQFELTGIPAAFKGVAKAEVAFEADVDGIVHVSASDLLSESEVKVKVSSTKLRDAQEIDELAADGRAKYEEDQKRRDRIQAGIEAENLLDAAEKVLKGPQGDIQLKRLVDAISRTREALGGEITEEIRLSCRDLLRLLQAIDKASPRAAAPN